MKGKISLQYSGAGGNKTVFLSITVQKISCCLRWHLHIFSPHRIILCGMYQKYKGLLLGA